MCRKGYYALNCMFICDADMKILALDPMRPGSDHDAFVWRTTWLRRRFQAGRIVNAGEYLLGDSGYPLEPWLLTPVPGHPPVHTAEGQYNTAHAAMRSLRLSFRGNIANVALALTEESFHDYIQQ
ncbi:putative nuclease HARBI1 [Dermacentor andersoni]|uniref:putative nuclease HARBI1 n=1 Tax=Dermacentor andersoni TaxID=34620 RepID=UPI003B3A6EE8